ncbi:MAG TPA: GNAT family N-acetyltransferase [Dokdonella sp.]|uniref:GNAT family N-acetyltransferase n=1 Tax=Dokdonella sp. TaxID=2291710 RepID=UPI0025BAB953|nr:GNAT family N-acetyltransferase [Dokdonella sp.]MBX3691282.1 GNAT family N-acetyltransferase [Dokdonella sp.]MCW5567870.1 GNAT family N-acetyltransferase [Dokdonella sp.]HNR91379.1 GNAT family N-acetyltransferase [Dokdonella sp.]
MSEPHADPLLVTARLALRPLDAGDAGFMLALLNDEAFIRNIADRGVRTLDEARAYIAAGPVASYACNGFGLWLVEERSTGAATGICGLVRRPTLDDVDIGFAFLPAWRGNGYAREAAQAVLDDARTRLGLTRVVAIVATANLASARVLEAIGLRYERMLDLGDPPETLRLFAWDA